MAKFDVEGARAAGYTDAEIADFLADEEAFDAVAAREAGYTDAEIIGYISAAPAKPVEPEPDRSAAQNVGVISSALLPYATAAGLGAAATGIPTGGLGAPLGAAAGVTSLGVADLGTAIYNVFAPAFDADRIPLPSETIRKAYLGVGIGRKPQTPEQEVLFRTVEGAGGGLSGATAFRELARTTTPGVTRNVMQELGRGPGVQTAAGAGAAAVPTIAREYAGVENPLAQFGLSVAGGMAGGRLATPRATPVTSEQFAKQADIAYQRARDAGVRFDTAAIANLAQDIRKGMSTPDMTFRPKLHPRINAVLEDIDDAVAEAQKNGTPISFSELELLRRVARTGARSLDADERRLGAGIIRNIDDFIDAPPPNAVVAGDAPGAAAAIKEARTAYRRKSQSDNINDMIIEKATDSAEGLNANTIRAAARAINKSKSKKRAFDPEIQKQIKDLGRGSGGLALLQTLGLLGPRIPTTAPEMLRNIPAAGLLTGSGAAAYGGSPGLALTGLTLAGGGMAANAAANKMALGKVNKMLDQARGTPAREMFKPQIAAQVAQQFGAPELAANADEKTVAIPPEMQAEMNAWFNQNPRGAVDLKKYSDFRRGLDAKYGFALDTPYEANPGIKYFVEQYNNPKAAVSLTIPKINSMRR